jgi:putative two-component system response regulator
MPKVLIVDDDEEIREVFRDFLLTKGYVADTALSGENALRLLDDMHPDVILLDIKMPGMTGTDVLREIKDLYPEMPVIMITALDDTETAVSAMKIGAYDYITKPVDLWQLETNIQKAIERGRLLRELREYRENLELKVKERTFALENALRALGEAHDKIKEAHLEIIYRLSLAAEFRDNHTASHLWRISEFSRVIARAAGMSDEEGETIRVASIMHDIGKIGIPDSILLKPGRLGIEEFNTIKKHPIIGGEILSSSDSDFLQVAEAIALTHHERYDGTGYPEGLERENIPIWGRIVAVADVFDALTSKRAYKPSFSKEEAYQLIKEGAGKHFDPDIVEAFFSEIDTIEEVKANYPTGELSFNNHHFPPIWNMNSS